MTPVHKCTETKEIERKRRKEKELVSISSYRTLDRKVFFPPYNGEKRRNKSSYQMCASNNKIVFCLNCEDNFMTEKMYHLGWNTLPFQLNHATCFRTWNVLVSDLLVQPFLNKQGSHSFSHSTCPTLHLQPALHTLCFPNSAPSMAKWQDACSSTISVRTLYK